MGIRGGFYRLAREQVSPVLVHHALVLIRPSPPDHYQI